MEKQVVTKRVIQVVAVCFGLLGLTWVCMGIVFVVAGVRGGDKFTMFVMTPAFILMGGVLVAIGYQSLRRFGPNAIKNTTALLGLTLLSFIPMIELSEWAADRFTNHFIEIAIYFLPYVLGLYFYSVVSKKLIRLSGLKSIQSSQPESGDGVG